MKTTIFGVSGFILLVSMAAIAQLPPAPVANIETEMRDISSGRMRELQLERFKRDANKLRPAETSKEAEIRFARVKDDFEGIQKLQIGIIKAYSTGKDVDYDKIQRFAAEINKRAIRLGINFFGTSPEAEPDRRSQELAQKGVRELIIEFDRKLGEFVGSSLFRNHVVVDDAETAKAEANLKILIRLSDALNIAAAKKVSTSR